MHMRHLMALSYVRDHDGGPQQELAEALCMDANNVVLLLNELEELGYISAPARPERPPAPPRASSRRRAQRARATPSSAQEAIEDDVLQALDADERATLWRLLGRALRGAEPELAAACEPAAEPLERQRSLRARRSRRSRRARPSAASATPTAARAGGSAWKNDA